MSEKPFSLQPRTTQQRGPQTISEFIRRVNAEPGGFRGLDEAELRRQVEARKNGTDRDDDVDMATPASEADTDEADTKDVTAARDEILRTIHLTHQTSMFALDFVSLLLSKENPAQAVTTFSPGLRDMVGIGTLGATMLDAPTALTQSRVPDNKMVAIGKRLMDLNKAADTALAASKRLQREIGSETKYWSEVLAVRGAGWQTFRLPHEPHTMGVKFGFSNTAPEFKANGVAPMRRAEDGSIRLEHGRMGGGSKRLQVRILENGVVVGRSSLPPPLPADAPIQDRVRESRDTIFAQELWHEINREGRTLLNRGVRLEKSAVTYTVDATRTISVRLATLGEEEGPGGAEQPGPQDAVAESLRIALSLLLSHAHRANEQQRSEPGANRGPPRAYPLLSPIITYYEYDRIVQRCIQSLADYICVLRAAGLNYSSITVKEPPLTPLPGAPASTALAAMLLQPPPVQFDVAITPASRLRILARPSQLYGAVFSVSCLPGPPPSHAPAAQPQPQPPQPGGAPSPLALLCPPGADEYDRLDELLWYLRRAAPCALAAHYKALAHEHQADPEPAGNAAGTTNGDDADRGSPPPATKWVIDISGKAVVDADMGDCGVHFDLDFAPDHAPGFTGSVSDGGAGGGDGGDAGGRRLQLSVRGDFVQDDGKKVRREWAWPGAEGSLDEAVRLVLGLGAAGVDGSSN